MSDQNATTKAHKLSSGAKTVATHYSKPNEVITELQNVINLTKTKQESDQITTSTQSVGVFTIENFQEVSEGGDDRIPSQSEDQREETEDQKDAGSTNVFVKLIAELNQVGSLQSVLAVSTINQSIDFSSFKFRQTFIAQSGIVALSKIISCMINQPISNAERQQFLIQEIMRVEPKVVYEVLLVLTTLAETGKESRRQLIGEDMIKIVLSLIKLQFAPSYQQQTIFRARCYRFLAAMLSVSTARNYVRRIQGSQIVVKQFRQAIKDYATSKSDDQACLIYGIALTLEAMLGSQRFKEMLIKQKLVSLLIESLGILPPQTKILDDMFLQTGQQRRQISPSDALMESLSNCLRLASTIQQGRTDILQANGIKKICTMLEQARSTKVIQRSVAVLAACAQDSGVDQAVRKAGGLTVLCKQLSSSDFQTLEAICKTIVAVCRSGPYFGSSESVFIANKDYLAFNKRNEENIIDLCAQDTVNSLGKLINQPKDILAQDALQSDAVIVTRTGEGDNAKLNKATDARQLVILATNALIPLLSCKKGRSTMKANGTLTRALIEHLSIGDVQVLISTLAAIFTACEKDPEICRIVSLQDLKSKTPKLSHAVKAMFSLLNHPNIQVVTAAAMALNPICRDTQRAFLVGREIPTALIQVSKLMLKADYDLEKDEVYLPYLIKEQRGWLMGVVAELAQDDENAKIFSQYQVLETICKLATEHAAAKRPSKAYFFYIDQLIKEKSALALASLAKEPSNMDRVAELQTIPALVSCIQTPDGVSVFSSDSNQLLGTNLQNCQNAFGSAVNFSLENQIKKQEERRTKKTAQETEVDRDPQQTANPYAVVNCAACRAMAELSKNKKCALLLRQYGAVYGLLTLAGSDEKETQEAAAQAIQNIRIHHLKALELYKRRIASELEYTREKSSGQKADENKVYADRVKAAIERIYVEMDATFGASVSQIQSGSMKRTSTLNILKRNATADRLLDKNDIEVVQDQVFTDRKELKVQQQAVTFTSVVGILKHPEVEEPVDVDQLAKEATVGSIDAFFKKNVAVEETGAQGAEEQTQQQTQKTRLKPVIRERPIRVAQPLGYKNPVGEVDRQAADAWRKAGFEKLNKSQCVEACKVLLIDDKFIAGLFKYFDNDKDDSIDEQQFVELYKMGAQVQKLETDDKYDMLFYVIDRFKDERLDTEELRDFGQKMGMTQELEGGEITKADFKSGKGQILYDTFYE